MACFCWTVCSGLQWTQDRLQGLSSMLHFAAWGIPAAHTLTVFVRRDADAEELTGELRKKIVIYLVFCNCVSF